jgi:hypothetical protein
MEDSLIPIGDLPGPDGKFPAWNLPINAAMERVYDHFVRHYDDPTLWEFSIWLGLTDSGKRLPANSGSDRYRNCTTGEARPSRRLSVITCTLL